MSEAGDWQTQVYDLMERAEDATGAEKVAILDEALRLAELARDLERATYIREELFQAAFWDGQYERALAEFNTMLAVADKNIDGWGGEMMSRLLWLYKWVIDHPQKFIAVSKAQIDAMFQDMQRRYEAAGLSMRAIHSLRCSCALDMGQAAVAREHYEKWQSADEDGSEDCPACELSAEVDFFVKTGDVEGGLKKAEPLFAGQMRCEEVPNTTMSFLLVPLVQRGQMELAKKSHTASIRQMRETKKFVGYLGNHLQYLALVGESTRGVKLLESRLAWALETRNDQDRFQFLLGARLLLARLAQQGRATIKLLLLESFEHVRADAQYDTQTLADQFYAIAKSIAERFDRRNGTDRYATLLAENEALIRFNA